MATAAELFLVCALGALVFRVLRPLRHRLEDWYRRNFAPQPRRGRVVDLRPRDDGAFDSEEKPDGN
jgi:hypothetical protein